MKNKLKFLFVFLLLIVLFPVCAFAHSAADGNNPQYGECSYDWCYSSEAIRFSLYQYKNSNLIYYRSVDVEAGGQLNGKIAKIPVNAAGKVAYTSGIESISWSSVYYKLTLKNSLGASGTYKIPSFHGDGLSVFPQIKNKIVSYFELNSSDTDLIRPKINSFFGTLLSDSDLPYIYITIEPTLYIYKKSTNTTYYGTAYELLNLSDETLDIRNGADIYGLNKVLYKTLPLSIVASNPTATDINNFVSSNSNAKVHVLLGGYNLNGNINSVSGRNSNRYKVINENNGNNGYGIGVFWIGDYVPLACRSSCSGKTGDNFNKCAENYCESNSSNSSEKKQCMVDCGYTDPGEIGCTESCNGTGNNTKCDEPNYSITGQSTKCNVNTYYTTKCVQKINDLKYSTDLPTIMHVGVGGFDYSASYSGSKNCTITFNYKKYQFDYAALKKADRVSGNSAFNLLNTSLNNYKNLSSTNTSYNYKIDSSDNIIVKVDGDPINYKMNLDSSDITNATIENSTDKIDVKKYSDNTVTYAALNIPKSKTYTSTANNIEYSLPLQCYSLRKNRVFVPDIGNNCEISEGDLLSYGYYALDTVEGKKNVKVTAKLNKGESGSSCLNNNHECYYVKNDDEANQLRCYIQSTKISGSSYKLEFNVDNHKNISFRYNFDNSGWLNGGTIDGFVTSKNKTISSGSEIIEGFVKYNFHEDSVTIPCSTEIRNTPSPAPNCKNEFSGKHSHYEEIRKYCEQHWKDDVAGYTSLNQCQYDCSDTCRRNYSCDDENGIKNYCNLKWAAEGYKSKEACINDCSCTGQTEYIYRPISLGTSGVVGASSFPFNAFPNREAGSNWKGYEEKYTSYTNVYSSSPIYTIELNNDSMSLIKSEDVSKYRDFEDYEYDDGAYKSKFIEDHDYTNSNSAKRIFTCVRGSGSGC